MNFLYAMKFEFANSSCMEVPWSSFCSCIAIMASGFANVYTHASISPVQNQILYWQLEFLFHCGIVYISWFSYLLRLSQLFFCHSKLLALPPCVLCVCVRERETDRQTETERDGERQRQRDSKVPSQPFLSLTQGTASFCLRKELNTQSTPPVSCFSTQ